MCVAWLCHEHLAKLLLLEKTIVMFETKQKNNHKGIAFYKLTSEHYTNMINTTIFIIAVKW